MKNYLEICCLEISILTRKHIILGFHALLLAVWCYMYVPIYENSKTLNDIEVAIEPTIIVSKDEYRM